MKRIVLAFAGGAESAMAIPWLSARHGAEIVTVTLDLGQGRALEEVRDQAIAAGAVRAHVLDVRDEFTRDYVLRVLKADALDEGIYPLVTALSWPLVARKLVDVAAIENTTLVAHGGSDEDDRGIDAGVRALDPRLSVLAPVREWHRDPAALATFVHAQGLEMPKPHEPGDRVSAHAWGRSVFGAISDAWSGASSAVYALTRAPENGPELPAQVNLTFERGLPTRINDVAMPLAELIETLSIIAGTHGVGRLDRVQRLDDGLVIREAIEAPSAVVLHTAHAALSRFATGAAFDRFSRTVAAQYVALATAGQWFSPFRSALDAYIDAAQSHVTGVIGLRLHKGSCKVVGHRLPNAVQSPDL